MHYFAKNLQRGQNFTPAELIRRYSLENGLQLVNCYGSVAVVIDGMLYGYDHYTVVNNVAGGDTVIICLALKSR